MSTILLIEDDKWLADLCRDVLQAGGHQVIVANDAQTGVEALDDYAVDVVILDIMLPGANGLQLLHEMRSYPDLAEVPVIIHSAVTAKESGLSSEDWRAYGVVGYVTKGESRPQDVLRAVNHVVARTS